MEDTEYELVAHDEVDRLKREVERLKTNPFVQNSSEERLYESISRLNDSVNKLYALFENVNKQLMKEYQNGNSPEEKIDKILDQNRSIAEALVTIGSKIDSDEEEDNSPSFRPQAPSQKQTQPQISVHQQATSVQPTRPPQQFTQNKPFPSQSIPVQQQQISQTQGMINQPPVSQRPLTPLPFPDDDLPPVPSAQNQVRFQQQPQFQRQSIMTSEQVPQPQRQMAPPIQQTPQYKQMYSQEDIFNPQVPPSQSVTQPHPFESGLNINYPTPDRFQSVNAPPSFEPPIDLTPPEPKKKGIGGLLSGILKK